MRKASALRFLLLIVIPALSLAWGGEVLLERLLLDLDRAETVAAAGLQAALLEQELGSLSLELSQELAPLVGLDLASPIAQGMRPGDTLNALGAAPDGSLQVTILVARPPQAGSPGSSANALLMYATRAIQPQAPRILAATSGMEGALFLRGERISGAVGTGLPEALPEQVQRIAVSSGGVVPFTRGGWQGALAPVGSVGTGTLLALAGRQMGTRSFPTRIPGLSLLLVSVVALLVDSRVTGKHHATGRSLSQWVTLLALPLATAAFLVALQQAARAARYDSDSRQMTRAAALLQESGYWQSPELARTISGYAATYLGGDTLQTTLDQGETLSALRSISLPPPGFTASGKLEISSASVHYTVTRLDETERLILSHSLPPDRGGPLPLMVLLITLGAFTLVHVRWGAGHS